MSGLENKKVMSGIYQQLNNLYIQTVVGLLARVCRTLSVTKYLMNMKNTDLKPSNSQKLSAAAVLKTFTKDTHKIKHNPIVRIKCWRCTIFFISLRSKF